MHRKQPFQRVERVDHLLRSMISEILLKKIQHPGIEGITITEVRVTPDFHSARVFYRVLSLEQKNRVKQALSKVGHLIQKEVAQQLHTRHTPTLQFEFDESLDYGNRIETLLESIRKPKEEDGRDPSH